MKTFQSASFDFPITASRKEAINKAKWFLNSIMGNANLQPGQRFTWRADDESGFTLTITKGLFAACVNKWNAARK